MSDNQVGAICASIFLIVFVTGLFVILGLRLRYDHLENMRSLEIDSMPANDSTE